MEMMITIIAQGTRGDVQPAVALGQALQAQGYRVRILASTNFREWIAGHGLEPAGARVNIQELMESAGGVEWVERGHNPLVQQRLMKKLLDRHGAQLAQDAWTACQGADAVISSFTSDAYVTAIAEKLDIPQICAALQPALIATRDGRAVLNGPLPGRRSIINKWFGKLLIEPAPWQLLGDITNNLRRELGLPPQSGRENIATRRQCLHILAYSPHVVPHPADWPPNVHTTGYWFLDEAPDWTPPAGLQAFLEAGPPPVYIGFGSMTRRDPQRTTQLILNALAICGQRAVVSAGWAGLGQRDLPADIFLLREAVPHHRLFPHMAAVVHHGGAGTTAAGLRAGVPTLIIPHFADQPFWGQRVYDLGVGPRMIWRHKLTATKLAQGIDRAVSDPQMKRQAEELGAKIRAEDGTGRAVALIDEWLETIS
jgi:UDP:flavonoid glycosyltransferase YjiC (YdhE family)